VAYLVRSFQTNARIRSLTTGTFNRVVKDRIAFRLSGANSVQANSHKCESDCPRNLTNIRCCARPCQRKRPTEFPLDFHNGNSGRAKRSGSETVHVGTAAIGCPVEQSSTGFPWKSGPSGPRQPSRESGALTPARTLKRAQRYGLPPRKRSNSAHAEAEDRKLRKDLAFGGPCLEGTLRKPTGVSESSPVAGAIEGFHPSKP
jgi:hypothetical protein